MSSCDQNSSEKRYVTENDWILFCSILWNLLWWHVFDEEKRKKNETQNEDELLKEITEITYWMWLSEKNWM